MYLVTVPEDAVPKGADDAETANFYKLRDMLTSKEKLAFDHFEILKFASERIGFKVWSSHIYLLMKYKYIVNIQN